MTYTVHYSVSQGQAAPIQTSTRDEAITVGKKLRCEGAMFIRIVGPLSGPDGIPLDAYLR